MVSGPWKTSGARRTQPIGFELLPEKFTIPQLQVALDKRNFRRKLLAMDLLRKLEEKEKNHREKEPGTYRFDAKIRRLTKGGFNFEL